MRCVAAAAFASMRQGLPWSLATVQSVMREVFEKHLESNSGLTTYSWLMGLQDQARLAGQGQGEAEFGKDASVARYALSLRTKHKVFAVAHALQSFKAWEVIPPEAVEAVLQESEKVVGAAVAQDGTALWTAPTEKADIQKRLVMLRKRQSTTAVCQRP